MNVSVTRLPMSTSALDHERVFEHVYREHRGDVFRWSLRYGGGRRAWAEDITHDVFLRLHRHLPNLDELGALQPWLYRATANASLNRLRDERSILGKLAGLFRSERDDAPTPEAKLSRRQAVLKALDALPPLERVVLCMKVLDGKSQHDVAVTLSISEGYVSKVIARGWEYIEGSTWEVDHAP